MNGEAFRGLNSLLQVRLFSNPCIEDNFITPSEIAFLPQTVSMKCGFDEPEIKNELNIPLNAIKILHLENVIRTREESLKNLANAADYFQRENEEKSSEVMELKDKIRFLISELDVQKEENKKLKLTLESSKQQKSRGFFS